MKFYRQFVDSDDREPITEEKARFILSATYKDVDLVIEAIKENGFVRTPFSFIGLQNSDRLHNADSV